MRIVTKRIKVIQMTDEEAKAFVANVANAQQGHTSHYAESRLSDGSFLGVQVLTDKEMNQLELASEYPPTKPKHEPKSMPKDRVKNSMLDY